MSLKIFYEWLTIRIRLRYMLQLNAAVFHCCLSIPEVSVMKYKAQLCQVVALFGAWKWEHFL